MRTRATVRRAEGITGHRSPANSRWRGGSATSAVHPAFAACRGRISMVPEILIDPLFAEHSKKRGEERGCETCIKQRLDGDDFGRKSGPGDGARVGAAKERAVDGVDQAWFLGPPHETHISSLTRSKHEGGGLCQCVTGRLLEWRRNPCGTE